ncbi:phenylacetate--CoA ligase family protein [Leptospira sp. 96542]|nr:phenylacetate--CoA ligase family protein [Leptospira sp. 96542]
MNDLSPKNKTPLYRGEWEVFLQKILHSEFAPKWNANIGDRIERDDYIFVKNFEKELLNYKSETFQNFSPDFEWLNRTKFSSNFYFKHLSGRNNKEKFSSIPFTTREDLQSHLTEIIPFDEHLTRMVINPTSGTTGQPILCPNHPKSIGCYVPLIKYSLLKHGVILDEAPDKTIAIQLCYQKETIVYATYHSLSNGATFAKINLDPDSWRNENHIDLFINELKPEILTGDPYSLESAMKKGILYKPKAIHSTALYLNQVLKKDLETHFQCPVINSYSLNETGPVAYSCPVHTEWMHILPHDLYVECIPTNNDSIGEIVVTGGRNPFFPLVRYKTGDYGEMDFSPCECKDPSPKLKLIEGRKPVYFLNNKTETINPVDVARILRMTDGIYQFQVIQKTILNFEVNLSVSEKFQNKEMDGLKEKFLNLFGHKTNINFNTKFTLNGKKVIPFINEIIPKDNELVI